MVDWAEPQMRKRPEDHDRRQPSRLNVQYLCVERALLVCVWPVETCNWQLSLCLPRPAHVVPRDCVHQAETRVVVVHRQTHCASNTTDCVACVT